MRTVYHGGITEITLPVVNVGRDNLDFGKGFYVTEIKSQAKTWAEIKSRYFLDTPGIINQYAFDFDNAVRGCRYRKFECYDQEWLYFVIDCRSGKNVWRAFDIIEGGVANDRVIDTIEAFIAGQIDENKALGELARHQPNQQICILRQSIINRFLKFERSFKVK